MRDWQGKQSKIFVGPGGKNVTGNGCCMYHLQTSHYIVQHIYCFPLKITDVLHIFIYRKLFDSANCGYRSHLTKHMVCQTQILKRCCSLYCRFTGYFSHKVERVGAGSRVF